MRLMVIGAYGKAGSLIAKQALDRRHNVTAVSRRRHPGFDFPTVLIKDARELSRDDVAGFDAIIDATGAWTAEGETVHYEGALHLMRLLRGTETRYLKVGGANTLFIDGAHTRRLQELPSYYPRYMQGLSDAHQRGLDILRRFSDVRWTYVTPAYKFAPFGEYTGKYHVRGEEYRPGEDDDRMDYISYADYAKAMIDIIERHQYVREQITLVSGRNPDPRQPW